MKIMKKTRKTRLQSKLAFNFFIILIVKKYIRLQHNKQNTEHTHTNNHRTSGYMIHGYIVSIFRKDLTFVKFLGKLTMLLRLRWIRRTRIVHLSSTLNIEEVSERNGKKTDIDSEMQEIYTMVLMETTEPKHVVRFKK